MTQVSRSHGYDASTDEVWGRIGDFYAMEDWHPAIASSEAGAGAESRVLTLQDGGQIFETRTAVGDHSYAYRIDESPLPVSGYASKLSVGERDGGGCEVTWEADFEADGVSEDEASALIGGIFDAGLGNL